MTTPHRSGWRFGLIAVVLSMSAGIDSIGASTAQGVRFNSPGVLDLADRTQKISTQDPLPIVVLAVADAEKILAEKTLDEVSSELQFSDDVYACKPASEGCSLAHESSLIAASAGVVKRESRYLRITPTDVAPVVFSDWEMAASKTADGDEEKHWYLGRLAGSGYMRVEVQFGHDAPGNFLINRKSGKVAFVHNGADVVAFSPDGLNLLTFNTLNPPLSLRIAALDTSGPRLTLQCAADKGGDRVTALFKGWRDVRSFDLVLEIRAARSKLMQHIALRLAKNDAGWSIASSAPASLEAIGFACAF